MKILLMVVMTIVSFSSLIYGDNPPTQYINNMIVHNNNEDSDVAVVEMRGNGESCLLDFGSDGEIYNTSCRSMINSKGTAIYCTPTKKLCKTYNEINAFIFEPQNFKDTNLVSNSTYDLNTENKAIPKMSNEVQSEITWRGLGIGIDNPGEIKDWTYFGIKTPKEASLWIDAFKPLEGISYAGAARTWKQNGFSAEETKNWIMSGIRSPEEVNYWLNSGVKSSKEVQLWKDIGLVNHNTVSQMKGYGVDSPAEAKAWINIGLNSPWDIATWISSGIKTPIQVQEWKDIGIDSASEAKKWMQVNVASVEEVKEWNSIGIYDAETCRQWKEYANTPQEVKSWIDKSYSIEDVANEMRNINLSSSVPSSYVTHSNQEGLTDLEYVGTSSQQTDRWQGFLIIYFIIMIITIFKGYGENRTVIIFRDYNDLGLTFLIPASAFLIFILFTSFGGNPEFGISLALIVAFVLFGILVKNTYMDNNKSLLYTSMSIMTKVPLGIIWILNFITMLNPSGKTATQRRKNRGTALVVLAFLTPIIGMVVVNKEGSFFNPKDWIKGRRIGSIRNHI